MTQVTVFFSWQSDLPNKTNRVAIRNAIREACIALEQEFDGVRFVQDEATRDIPGSPNIAQVVQGKIEAADVFVADITTITEAGAKRACPNPNVMYELGYAAAYLGWERIILVFNEAYGDRANDTPFDIRQQRATPYTLSEANANSGSHKHLGRILTEAIRAIYTQSPKRPAEARGKTPQQVRHERDVILIKRLMSSVSRSALDQHIDRSPRSYTDRDLEMWDRFNAIVTSSTFALNDTTLAERVDKLHSSWTAMIGGNHDYREVEGQHSHDTTYFFRRNNAPLKRREQKVWDEKEKAKEDMVLALRELLDHIRLNFLEVDLAATDDAFEQGWNKEVEQAKKRATS